MHWPKWSQTKDSEATQHAKTEQKGGACCDFLLLHKCNLPAFYIILPVPLIALLVVTRMF
jgi:hypothetical protein